MIETLTNQLIENISYFLLVRTNRVFYTLLTSISSTNIVFCGNSIGNKHWGSRQQYMVTISHTSIQIFSVVLWRGRMAGLELVLLARICTRVGVLAVSINLSPIQYRPCFFPPPTLITTSASMGSVLGSKSGPFTSVAIELYSPRRLWTVAVTPQVFN